MNRGGGLAGSTTHKPHVHAHSPTQDEAQMQSEARVVEDDGKCDAMKTRRRRNCETSEWTSDVCGRQVCPMVLDTVNPR